jgi:hypothetical protein
VDAVFPNIYYTYSTRVELPWFEIAPFLHCRSSDLETNPGIRASSIDARGVVGYCASLASLAMSGLREKSEPMSWLHKDPEVLPFLREQSTALEIDHRCAGCRGVLRFIGFLGSDQRHS